MKGNENTKVWFGKCNNVHIAVGGLVMRGRYRLICGFARVIPVMYSDLKDSNGTVA